MPATPYTGDPRKAGRPHRERGPKRFVYTYGMIAEAKGKSITTVYKDVQRGKFDPSDLLSLSRYLLSG